MSRRPKKSKSKRKSEQNNLGLIIVAVVAAIALLLALIYFWRQSGSGTTVETDAYPYDASNPVVQQVLNQIPLVVHHEQGQTCASHAGLNNLLPEVVSGNVLGPHSGDFVYKGDNVLFKYNNGAFQLIYESPSAGFENDEASLPLGRAMQLFANGDIVWTGRFGDWPARGVPGCDESAG